MFSIINLIDAYLNWGQTGGGLCLMTAGASRRVAGIKQSHVIDDAASEYEENMDEMLSNFISPSVGEGLGGCEGGGLLRRGVAGR